MKKIKFMESTGMSGIGMKPSYSKEKRKKTSELPSPYGKFYGSGFKNPEGRIISGFGKD